MRRPLIAGNWKLNGTRESAVQWATEITESAGSIEADLLVCPSFTLIAPVVDTVSDMALAVGSQNIALEDSGAFTGEVSAAMVAEAGCAFAIVGHSERRALFGDSNDVVSSKVSRALGAGLTPIVCVGESLEERDAGDALDVVVSQLDSAFAGATADSIAKCVLAYEPVWAIGTGRSASPEQAQEVHAAMRDWLCRSDQGAADTVRLLYGGSVKPDNAAALFEQNDIDGALIGGASLVAADFLAIARAAA